MYKSAHMTRKKKRKSQTLDKRLSKAVSHFWRTRLRQDAAQGSNSGHRDHGNRTATTGGKQLDGFNSLFCELLLESGIPDDCIFRGRRLDVTLPGFFRPTKQWDLLVVVNDNLLAAIETKSLCGPSFGNNYNNRVEEAVGSATDIWTAYREGLFEHSPEPLVGYLLFLEEHEKSTQPVRVTERHFPVFDEFREATYVDRCEQTVRRLIHERCYNAAYLITSNKTRGIRGGYAEPASDLGFARFVKVMCGHVKTNYDAVI